MSLNGLGQYIVNSTGQPVVSGTTISTTVFNALTADLATALSTAVYKDGQQTMTANIPMNNFKLTGLGAPSVVGDALAYAASSSWTPTDASGAGIVFTTAQAAYLKIGRLVFVAGIVIYPATADSSAAKIGSLPFSGSSATGLSRQIVPLALSSGTNPILIVTPANTTFTLQTIGGTPILNSSMGTVQIQFNGIYLTDGP